MHFASLKNALILGMAALSTAEFLDKEVYLQHSAPRALARINDIRAQHGNNLSRAQNAVLELSETIVNNFAVDEIAALEKMCEAAFGKDKCASLFGDDSHEQEAGLQKRIPACGCSTGANCCSDYPVTGKKRPCLPHQNNSKCTYSSYGCGHLFTMYCNGYCG